MAAADRIIVTMLFYHCLAFHLTMLLGSVVLLLIVFHTKATQGWDIMYYQKHAEHSACFTDSQCFSPCLHTIVTLCITSAVNQQMCSLI